MPLKFSIVTPTLNNLEKLRRCVGSVRGQLNVDLEHIIHDACSTDGTVEWAKKQHKLSFTSQVDNGMYDAINNAWDESTGDIFVFYNQPIESTVDIFIIHNQPKESTVDITSFKIVQSILLSL